MKKWVPMFAAIMLFCFASLFAQSPFFTTGAIWSYLDDGSNQGTAWKEVGFVQNWPTGPSPLGYGNNGTGDATSINKHNCTYLLKTVTVGSAAGLSNLYMDIVHDDGVIVYINGAEVIRSALVPAGTIDYMTELLGYKDPEDERVSYSVSPVFFVDGENVIAVELRNQRESSSDIQFDMIFWGDYNPPDPVISEWKSYKPLASSDDAEEHTDTNASEGIGGMEPLDSSDLELGNESGTNNQIVGIRFPNVDIPRGTTIDSSYIQFTCDDDNTGSFNVMIWAEDTDDAATFTTNAFDISSRFKTEAVQLWNIPDWITIDQRGPDQRTTDLAALVQEVIDRSGWATGNAMVFIIHGQNGEREAEAWDEYGASNTTGHPELFIKVGGGTAVEEKDDVVVRTYRLLQNYPNPFNPSTTIDFDIAKAGHVTLSVYNILGQEVATLVDQEMGKGHHTVQWYSDETTNTGIYFYKINSNGNVLIRKMMLIK